MIIVKLQGGLGNQLFQYALGRCVTLRLGTSLKLDTSSLGKNLGKYQTVRHYSLDRFNIVADIATENDLRRFRIFSASGDTSYSKALRKIVRYALDIKPIGMRSYVREPSFRFCQDILSVKDGSYLDGYWQSEKYFGEIRDVLIKEITLKNGPSRVSDELRNEIRTVESVALHIRRGDAVDNPRGHAYHGYCPNEYYERGMGEIAKAKGKDVVIFVFSDDVEWVKSNLNIPYPARFVSSKETTDYEELVLMSECKNQIISNSTFSWWGAWLNNNPNKIVVAPKRFLRDAKIDTSDLLPQEWIMLDNNLL
jgi:hypothetical protein